MANKSVNKHFSPLRYPGGKNCIFPFVSNLLRENNLIGVSYAEPYAGGSGLALRLLITEHVNHIYLNDLDRSIYAFWDTVLSRGDLFCYWLERVDISVENWLYYRDVLRSAEIADTFDLAKATFFLNRTNVSGVLKGGIIGGLNQTGKYKIGARFNKKELISRIKMIGKYSSRISISNNDGIKFIKRLDSSSKNIFIYLDPPYVQKGSALYLNSYSEADHKALAKYVHKMKKEWMVSYDNHEFVLNLYSEDPKVVYSLSQSTSNRVGNEVLVFNSQLKFEQSIRHLKSASLL